MSKFPFPFLFPFSFSLISNKSDWWRVFEYYDRNIGSIKQIFETITMKHLMTVIAQIEIELFNFVRPTIIFRCQNPWFITMFNLNNNISFVQIIDCARQNSFHGHISKLSTRSNWIICQHEIWIKQIHSILI
jgi:hypothetical protein